MHIHVPDRGAEVHVKASYRKGGRHFVVKIAGSFTELTKRNLPAGNGMMMLLSAETGEPVALLCDGGDLTDARTAAVAAMVANELKRTDSCLGILGSGTQARWQARAHAEVLPLREVWLWGRNLTHAQQCRTDLTTLLPDVDIRVANSPAEVAQHATTIVTTTAARAPLLMLEAVTNGTLISAIGSDSPGKQELDPQILERASLVLVDSKSQCERLGELQHAPRARDRVIEMGKFCDCYPAFDADGIIVADFTGLGVEDLFAAEGCLCKL
jgi:ornithine cyclodeaminase